MAVLKVRRSNGEVFTVNLTTNASDTGGNYIRLHVNGQTLYARLGDAWTPLSVRKPNGTRQYAQENPIVFTTWNWSKYPEDVRGIEKMFVYLPKGRYRATVHGKGDDSNEFTVDTSRDIEVNVSMSNNNESATRALFNVNGWRKEIFATRHELRIQIERIGE